MTDVTPPSATRTAAPAAPPAAPPVSGLRPTARPKAGGRRARNPRGEGERLRRDLLDSALDLLSEAENPDEVSIRAIARRTGVSATAAYRHFEDRDDLVYAAVMLAFERFRDLLARAVADAADPFDALSRAGAAYRRFAEESPGRYRVLFSNPMACPLETSLTDDEVEAGYQALDQLVALVQACLDAGAPAAATGADAEYLSVQLWTWIHGICDLRITHPDHEWPSSTQMFDDAQRLLGLTRP
jgi:AcrR family transcriptional regulator